MKIKKKSFFLVIAFHNFSSDCPLQIWPLKTYNKDISKTITASRLRFGQLIVDCESIKNLSLDYLSLCRYAPFKGS